MTRLQRRIAQGLTNPAPNSTKVSKHTEAPKRVSVGPGYRTNRFNK